PWNASSTRQLGSPSQATPCCWRRDVPRWTCSPTTAPEAMPLLLRSGAAWMARLAERQTGGDSVRPGERGSKMTTANPVPMSRRSLTSWWTTLRHAMDRPLTSYYLLLGASALLLTIGLIMVLSASSVRSFRLYDDSYAIVRRQLTW